MRSMCDACTHESTLDAIHAFRRTVRFEEKKAKSCIVLFIISQLIVCFILRIIRYDFVDVAVSITWIYSKRTHPGKKTIMVALPN